MDIVVHAMFDVGIYHFILIIHILHPHNSWLSLQAVITRLAFSLSQVGWEEFCFQTVWFHGVPILFKLVSCLPCVGTMIPGSMSAYLSDFQIVSQDWFCWHLLNAPRTRHHKMLALLSPRSFLIGRTVTGWFASLPPCRFMDLLPCEMGNGVPRLPGTPSTLYLPGV
jgi:hypothetical protein